jgi:hypothetical protein
MSERTKKFTAELDVLIAKGDMLSMAIQSECHPEAFKLQVSEAVKGEKAEVAKYFEELPNFNSDYQAWYTEAQEVIRQVMPNRLLDFVSYFDVPKARKDITFQNYMIRDYLQGLRITRGWEKEVVVDGTAAIPQFTQQLNMVKAAKATLESSLMDLKAVIQADLFDSEIETAGVLAKAGYLRAAGAICGVVLEKHLHHVCDARSIRVAKKNPGVSDLIQILKDGNVITVAQWRFIQSLADTRNLCDHAKGREPNKEEITDLIAGTERTLKQVF